MRGLLLAALVACDWDVNRMNDQPRCEPGDRRPWLPDARCDQAPPDGTVVWRAAEPAIPPVTRASILRGADRYGRTCAACHGVLGDASTRVAEDMSLRPPPSLHDSMIVAYSDQRLYEVITSGYGMMPSYAWQLAAPDRWAVVHYVRVLQRSQAVRLDALPADRKQEAQQWLR